MGSEREARDPRGKGWRGGIGGRARPRLEREGRARTRAPGEASSPLSPPSKPYLGSRGLGEGLGLGGVRALLVPKQEGLLGPGGSSALGLASGTFIINLDFDGSLQDNMLTKLRCHENFEFANSKN
ncbi:unnamed protein product [Calypogeia fissa]